MAITKHEINTYRIFHVNQDKINPFSVINCYMGNIFKGALYFYNEGTSIPASTESNGHLYLSFSNRKLYETINKLREKKPVFIAFNNENRWGWLDPS